MNIRHPFQRTLRAALLLGSLALALTPARAIPAFPGAEGFGQNALGGRGGAVYRVTNLNDSGAGSFRDAVSVSNRTVVFDVGGIIRLTSGRVAVKSNITIAGQTAPGGGITIYGNGVSFSDAHNTICRYIRFRQGINGDSGTDAVGIASGTNMIFDHVSASWGRDETFSISGGAIANITLQDCIIGQGLLVHSAGGLVQPGGGVSIFRTLYIDNWMRNPKIKSVNDYRNNVVYNWGSGGGYIPAGDSAGDSFANMIGNYFIGGFDSGIGTSPFKTGNLNYRLFHADNREDLNLDGSLNGTAVTDASFPTLQLVATAFAYPSPLITLTPEQALQHIALHAGASHRRDSVDTDMIDELLSYGTLGKQIFNESEVGGVGLVAPAPTAVVDTDLDGMPNAWEQAAGTNPAVADNNGDIDGDGYTNIENYINSLVVTGVPQLSITGISTDTGASAADGVTTDATLVITGTAPAGATVRVSRLDTGVLGTVVADGSGAWSYDYTGVALTERHYGFKAALVLGVDSFSLSTPALLVKVDNTAPVAPAITSLITSPVYTFTGTAEIFSTVNVVLEGVGIVATTTADGVGNWSAVYEGAPLAPGLYNFTAAATDLAGNTGAASATYSVNTALTAPVFTGISTDSGLSATDQITNDTTLTLAGTAPALSTVAVTRVGTGVIGSFAANGAGAWTFALPAPALAPGEYTFTATASSGGSSSPASAPFLVTVDTARPTVAIARHNPATVATTSPVVVFRATMNEPVTGVDTLDFTLVKTPGTLGGTIASVTQVTPSIYDVTVTGVSGDGTIKVDRPASATITDHAGNTTNTAFTGGQLYTIRLAGSGVWTSTESGDLWSDAANWENNVVATGSGVTADFSTRDLDENVTAQLDSPRTVGRVVFGDADHTAIGAWTLSDNGNPANILTLAGGTPTIQVNALVSSPASDPVDVPAANAYPTTLDVVLAGTAGLTKTGVGTLLLTKPNTISGALTVTKGIVEVGVGGTLTPSSVSLATSQQLRISGGTFNTPGNVTWTSGTGTGIIVNSGIANFQKILPSNFRNSFVRVNGGTVTATEITFPRSGDSETQAIAAGIFIAGGETTVGAVGLGTGNSWGAMAVSGGKISVTDILNVGFQSSTDGRGGVVNLSAGELAVTNAASGGMIMSRNPGATNNNISKFIITGGVANIAKLTLGFDSTCTAGSATVSVSSGALNLGSGGIVKNGTAGMATTLTFTSGTLGALAPWSTTHPLVLAGTPANFAIRAANGTGTPFNIALNGILSGAGGFAKTGAGTLTLGAANTFAGNLDLNAGTLLLSGSLGAGGTFNVNNGGLLVGAGTSNKAIALNNGGVISPGIGNAATLNGSSFTWNGGGALAFDIGAASDQIALTGAFNKGTAGTYNFALNSTVPVALGQSYTVFTFGSTNFTDGDDFSVTGLGNSGVGPWNGSLTVNANSLVLTITSAGAGVTAFNNWIAASGLPVGQNGPNDDGDNDGKNNLLEYILAENPTAGGGDGIVQTQTNVAGDIYPTLQFRRRQDRADVQVGVRCSIGLDGTGPLGTVEVSAVDQGDGTDLVVVRSAASLTEQPTQFLRVFARLP